MNAYKQMNGGPYSGAEVFKGGADILASKGQVESLGVPMGPGGPDVVTFVKFQYDPEKVPEGTFDPVTAYFSVKKGSSLNINQIKQLFGDPPNLPVTIYALVDKLEVDSSTGKVKPFGLVITYTCSVPASGSKAIHTPASGMEVSFGPASAPVDTALLTLTSDAPTVGTSRKHGTRVSPHFVPLGQP